MKRAKLVCWKVFSRSLSLAPLQGNSIFIENHITCRYLQPMPPPIRWNQLANADSAHWLQNRIIFANNQFRKYLSYLGMIHTLNIEFTVVPPHHTFPLCFHFRFIMAEILLGTQSLYCSIEFSETSNCNMMLQNAKTSMTFSKRFCSSVYI